MSTPLKTYITQSTKEPTGPYTIYVLACEHNTFYVGRTKNLLDRIASHESGRFWFTRLHKPLWLCCIWENQSHTKEKKVWRGFAKVYGSINVGGYNFHED